MLISRISANLDKHSRIIAVESLVLSIINYCIRIWGTTNIIKLNEVQNIQNFVAKVAIGGAKKIDHVTPIIQQLRWMKRKERQTHTCF